MNNLLYGGVCARFCLWLAAYARECAPARFFRFMARQYDSSRVKMLLDSALGAPMRATGQSGVIRLTGRVWVLLRRFAAWLCPERSLVARTARTLRASKPWGKSWVSRLEPGELLLSIFCLYLPVEWLMRQAAPEQVGILWDHVFLALCFLMIFARKMNPDNEYVSDATPLDGPLVLFLGVGVLLLCVVSPYLSVAISGWRAVYEYMLWFFVVVRLARTRRAARLCYLLFILMGVALGLHAIYQYIVAAPMPSNWVSIFEAGVRTRAYSIVGSPNILGCLMVMLAPMAAGMAYTAPTRARRALCWCSVAVMCLGCLFTFSRGAWVGMCVAVLLFALLRDRRLLLLGALGLLATFAVPQIRDRIAFVFTPAFEKNNTTGGRGARWAYGLDLLARTDPVFGFGLGRFGGAIAMQNQTEQNLRYFYMDNYYLKTLVEMGYIGLAGYLFLLLSMLASGLRALFRLRAHSERYSMVCGIFAGLVGALVHCYFENIFEVPYMNAYFWGLCALMMVIGWRINLKKKEWAE